ncbi:MAG: hypothetical protein GY817_03730 [bacterium]|nr:hypothetical protein [bacterium]
METVELVEMLDCMRDIERGMQRDIAFYRSCLNSGKTPKDGDEPSAQIKEKRIMSEHTTKQTKQDAAVAAYRAARADAFTTKAIADAVQAKAAVAKAKSAYIRADKKAAYYQAYTKRYAGAARHRVKTANAKVKAAKADYEKTKAMYLNPGDLTMAEIIEDLMERVMELEAKSNI